MWALRCLVAVTLAGAPSPAKKTLLQIDVKPQACVVYVDGVKKGTGAKPFTIPVTPGRHKLKVVNGKDSLDDSVVVKKGELNHWKWEFTDNRPGKKPSAEPTDDQGGEQNPPAEEKAPDSATPAP